MMKRNALKKIRRSPQRKKLCLIASLVGVMFIFPGVGQLEAYGQTRSTEAVRAELANFFEVYLGRKLSQNELDQVTKEFIPLFGSNTCEAKCVQALDIHKSRLAIFKTKRGQPEEMLMRHTYVSLSYYKKWLTAYIKQPWRT